LQNFSHRSPTLARRINLRRKVRPDLVAIGWEVIEQHTGIVRREPPCGITARVTGAAVPPPEHHRRKTETRCERRKVRRMPEGVGAIQQVRRRGAEGA
jgi:hypothetical protein